MPQIKKIFLSILLSFSLVLLSFPSQRVSALPFDSFSLVILSQYKAEVAIGDELYVIAVTSTGKKATWKSSDSKIASVNTYGVIKAKKAGTAIITAKIKDAEASCQVVVKKTTISVDKSSASLEHGESIKLTATTSNHSTVKWKSSKRSIATIDDNGKVTGMKPGETIITATADGSSVECTITVKLPTVKLNKSSVTLYRGQTSKLTATVSSKITPSWKTNKKSVAVVDASGNVTAIKHGSAIITATVDGVTQTCEIIVQPPLITLSTIEISLKKGDTATLTATVSSNNLPIWSTSNTNIVSVTSKGELKANEKGKAYVYASEDGTKTRCTVIVTE